MRKSYLFIFFLCSMMVVTNAWACIHSYQSVWFETTIFGTIRLLFFWMFGGAIYFVIRWLICHKSKSVSSRKLKTVYLKFALIYTTFWGIMLGTFYFSDFRVSANLSYLFYVLYVICCCGYQFWANIKNRKPKKWVWIYPIIPFFVVNHDYLADFGLTSGIEGIITNVCLLAIYIAVAFGLYKFEKTKNSPKKKIIWSLILILACLWGSCVLYKNYTYVETQDFTDCL